MMKKVLGIILATAMISGGLVADEAADKKMEAAQNAVKARQGYMRLQVQQLAVLGGPGTGKAPITEETVARAKNLYNLTIMLPDQFAEGSSMEVVESSTAKIEMWQNIEERDAIVNRLSQQAARLLMMAEAGDDFGFQDEFKQLRKTCNKCHEDFRYKEEN